MPARTAIEAIRGARANLIIAIGIALVLTGALGCADLPQHRASDPRAAEFGRVHRGRRLRERRSLHRGRGRNRRAGPLGGRAQAGRGGDGRAALGQGQRRQAHGGVAGCDVSRRIRATAHFGPRAGARRRCRRLLPVRKQPGAHPAHRELWPGGRRQRRGCSAGFLPTGRGPGRPVRARAQAGHPDAASARLSADLLGTGQGGAGPGHRVAAVDRRHAAGGARVRLVSRAQCEASRRCWKSCCRWSR